MKCPKCLAAMQKDLNSGNYFCVPCINKKPARSKYGVAVKEDRTYQGITFDSKAEMNRYILLKREEKAGKITHLKTQAKFPIYGWNTRKLITTYIADFSYIRNGEHIVEDVKGVKTAIYQLKKKLVKEHYGIDITEVR